MKHVNNPSLQSVFFSFLKSKEPRLRDWNVREDMPFEVVREPWNQKNLDYEIETAHVGLDMPLIFTWNQKNLDYEIETNRAPAGLVQAYQTLKSKEPRLRDWNLKTRLPPRWATLDPWNQKNLDYEIETCWIQSWRSHCEISCLKSKEPRLRDWNSRPRKFECRRSTNTWNQKNLDYEIETTIYLCGDAPSDVLEIKRTSITRLKQVQIPFRLVSYFASWNQKNLDYEIETSGVKVAFRDRPYPLKSKEPRLRDWNDDECIWCAYRGGHPWNQKNLDYEIETSGYRDVETTVPIDLKSKEPRLRDWNHSRNEWHLLVYALEIKRTSITRLKLL